MSQRWRETWDDFTLWLGLRGFVAEVPFPGLSGKRRYRWDYARPDLKLAIEYDGRGVGHQGIAGAWRDAEKSNEAALCGWTLIRCNAATVTDGRCQAWIETALGFARGEGVCDAQEAAASARTGKTRVRGHNGPSDALE